MRLRDQIDRLKELIDRPTRFENGGGGISTIIVTGGLPEPMAAYFPGTETRLDAWDGEPLSAFRQRAVERAREVGRKIVVISGVSR